MSIIIFAVFFYSNINIEIYFAAMKFYIEILYKLALLATLNETSLKGKLYTTNIRQYNGAPYIIREIFEESINSNVFRIIRYVKLQIKFYLEIYRQLWRSVIKLRTCSKLVVIFCLKNCE